MILFSDVTEDWHIISQKIIYFCAHSSGVFMAKTGSPPQTLNPGSVIDLKWPWLTRCLPLGKLLGSPSWVHSCYSLSKMIRKTQEAWTICRPRSHIVLVVKFRIYFELSSFELSAIHVSSYNNNSCSPPVRFLVYGNPRAWLESQDLSFIEIWKLLTIEYRNYELESRAFHKQY